MEPHSAVNLLAHNENFKATNVRVDVLVGYENAATIAHVQKANNHTVKKWINKNHTVKKFGSKLWSLAGMKFKFLTSDSINYLNRCFNSAILQNKNNVTGLQEAIRNMSKHTFEPTKPSEIAQMFTMFHDLVRTMENNQVVEEQKLLNLVTQHQGPDKEISKQNFQVMPHLSKVVEDFIGEVTDNRGVDWLQRLQGMATLHAWPEQFLLETARSHSTGAVHNWYKALRDEIRSWREFEEKFTKSFTFELNLTERWSRMRARKQSPQEHVTA
ncbi:hypothetical protein FQA39_LY02748 [Lamprigera yunnana]|nr:hypothetical protein FQA39_LY02748 [Lamprigera yunnana]